MKLLYPLARRFIAGHDFDSAKDKITKLIEEGYEVSVDYVGELSATSKDAASAAKQYVDISNFYKDVKIDMSIKPTQLGLSFDECFCEQLLRSVVKRAYANGHTVRLDMEDVSVTDKTIEFCLKIKKDFPNIGVAIQANLYRTEEDLKNLMKHGVSVRLVKGAYKESPEISRLYEEHTRAAFFDYAARLYSEKANKPAIATHDEELLEDIKELVPNPKYFDYEFLYGIRRDLQKRLLNEGHVVRIYVPFGKDWLPYILRRLKEWKNLKFVIKNIFKEWWRCLTRKN